MKPFFTVLSLFLIISVFAQNNSVRINEFLTLNSIGLTDENSEYSDWIELYNYGNSSVSLLGWSLTDNIDEPGKWLFPNISIAAGDYLLVFASGNPNAVAGEELHTNFKLKGSGEYLGLYNSGGEAVSDFAPFYPPQATDESFGFIDGGYTFFSISTPGDENTQTGNLRLTPPMFSVTHGFFYDPFELELSNSLDNVKIYYTTDGSEPSPNNGTLYSGSVEISTTTVLRATAFAGGYTQSEVVTRTFIFTDDVIRQTNTPAGYPAEWGSYAQISGVAKADYEMDPELMADPVFAENVKKALLEIPTVSLVTDKNNFFGKEKDSETGGIYIYTGPPRGDDTGRGWERPVSFEYFDAGEDHSLQINCGVEIHGGHSRLPEKSPKHSFRLEFKSMYGPSRLEYPIFGKDEVSDFNKLIIRSDFCNSWVHHSSSERNRAVYSRDHWARLTQRDMGHLYARQDYAHLYLNGIYWGLYYPTERMDSDYASSHLGGKAEDYDVIKDYTEVANGSIDAWNRMISISRQSMHADDNFQKIQGNNPDGTPNYDLENYLDVDNLIDYMLINMYGGNTDWDHHNWAAMRSRVNPGKGFKFICWDSEHVLKSRGENMVNEKNNNCPSEIFQNLKGNASFRRLVGDRAYKHCFNNGALTPEVASQRWQQLAAIADNVVSAESARWGDYRRDVHRYQTSGPFDLYTRENHFLPQKEYLLNSYFPDRTEIFISQLKQAGLFPNTDAPVVMINSKQFVGGEVTVGDALSMEVAKGTIYYTLDGTDPADGQNVSSFAKAYSNPVSVNYSAIVKARTYNNGDWSALNEVSLIIREDYNDLKITEIHYNPLGDDNDDGNQYEFIEIKNTGQSTLYLGGVQFVDGISYTFPEGSLIESGGFIVLTSDMDAFYNRYGFLPFDAYEGQLNNGGEWITVTTAYSDTIIHFEYDDSGNWSPFADGVGSSLVPVDMNPDNDQNSAIYWKNSLDIGGSPGRDDLPTSVGIFNDGKTSAEMQVNVFPNPFNNVVYIDYILDEASIVTLKVMDYSGREIIQSREGFRNAGLNQWQWEAGNVRPGVYFVHFIRGNSQVNSVVYKIIKIN
ncbi:MAG: lamin tail domain-containing protein [Prolixibacteraceae bacterium]|nr:lamin tail domain-containing protein [Prolixibacteraceae bacterium]